jgi:MscS family membrane protein
VESVGSRNIRVRRLDQAYVTIPNSIIAAAPVVNWTRLSRRRFYSIIGVTYSTKSSEIRTLVEKLREMLKARERLDPETVQVHFNGFGDSSLNIRVACMVLEPDFGLFLAQTEEINLAIMDIVDGMGLSFAFPSQSLYIENLSAINPPDNRSPEQNL